MMVDELKTEKGKKTVAIAKMQKSHLWSSREGATSCNAMKQQTHPTTCSSQLSDSKNSDISKIP